ncbi:hypothetical protein SFRURICE_000568 [Spodoptera frugiperda]|nr:hypothetical protein SFRURICE_000568 [Spodoptera frugiperda]
MFIEWYGRAGGGSGAGGRQVWLAVPPRPVRARPVRLACVQVHGPFDTSQPPRRLFAALLLTLAYVTALFTRHEHAIVLNYVTWTHLSNTHEHDINCQNV